MKQVLRKLMTRTIQGNVETSVFERIEGDVLTAEEIQELINTFGDDTEEAYFCYGLMIDFSDEVIGIVLDTLADGLKDYLENDDNEDKTLEEVLKKVEPLRAFNLDFEDEGTREVQP